MLIAFLSYQNKKFLRNFQYIGPVVIYLIWLMINYMYRDLPILPSYAISMIGLLPIITWITIVNFNNDTLNERYLFYIQLTSKVRYLVYKSIYLLIFSIPFILIALFIPLILDSFSQNITINTILISLLIHMWSVIFGIMLGITVQKWFLNEKKYAWLITILLLLITFIKNILIEHIGGLKWILWIFPPIDNFIKLLNNDNVLLLNPQFISLNIYCIVYTVLFIIISLLAYKNFE